MELKIEDEGLYIAFRKADNLLGALISLWTIGDYSHVELIVDKVALSSGGTDGGVREKDIIFHSEDWDIYKLSEDLFDKDKVLEFFNATGGSQYDWKGFFFNQLFFMMNKDAKDKWFCSEWCLEALDYATGKELMYKDKPLSDIKKYSDFSPNRLHKYLKDYDILGIKVEPEYSL